MDKKTTTAEHAAEVETLCSAGLSAALAVVIAEAFREHDAAGRPPIGLASAEEALCGHLARTALPSTASMGAVDLGETNE